MNMASVRMVAKVGTGLWRSLHPFQGGFTASHPVAVLHKVKQIGALPFYFSAFFYTGAKRVCLRGRFLVFHVRTRNAERRTPLQVLQPSSALNSHVKRGSSGDPPRMFLERFHMLSLYNSVLSGLSGLFKLIQKRNILPFILCKSAQAQSDWMERFCEQPF
ncbi:hypothetical protein GOODEAATRI_022160 [Goodea atripinnis]|uniref:Transmembrane protein n=1 Tax=Goodea atripinnis TaxID=208336 RepID=A0ABV0NYJ1_9TELE